MIPSEDAAPAITNVVVLPLYFLSGVLIPETEIPDGVLDVAVIFPIRHFFEAFFAAWDPATAGAGFEWGHLAVVAAWGVARPGARDQVLPLDPAAGLAGRANTGRLSRDPSRLRRRLGPRAQPAASTTPCSARSAGGASSTTTSQIGWGIVRPVFFACAPRMARRAPSAATSALRRAGSRRSRPRGRAACEAGGTDDGAPGPRPEYGAGYYSAYLLDPDGHRVEIAVQSN